MRLYINLVALSTAEPCMSADMKSVLGNMKTLMFVAASFSIVVGEVKIIDLTHVFGYKTLYWPDNPPFNLSLAFKLVVNETIVAVSNVFQTAEHSGTHMDAPIHFCVKGLPVHQIPLDRMYGPGVMLDFRSQAAKNADFGVTAQHIKDWEKEYGMIPKGAIVLLNFGWNAYWADFEKAFKSTDLSNHTSFHWPGLLEDASQFLSAERKIIAVGTDAPSIDIGQSTTFKSHINLLCLHGKIILENVGNIDALPETGSTVFIGAIKLENGSGTPVRLFATVGSGANGVTPVSLTLAVCFAIIYMICG